MGVEIKTISVDPVPTDGRDWVIGLFRDSLTVQRLQALTNLNRDKAVDPTTAEALVKAGQESVLIALERQDGKITLSSDPDVFAQDFQVEISGDLIDCFFSDVNT